jgi:hypothetical protein
MKLTDIAIRALRVPDRGQKDYWVLRRARVAGWLEDIHPDEE